MYTYLCQRIHLNNLVYMKGLGLVIPRGYSEGVVDEASSVRASRVRGLSKHS